MNTPSNTERRWKEQIRQKALAAAGLSPRMISDLDEFGIVVDRKELEFVRNGGGLYIKGQTGSGKTRYAAAMIERSVHESYVSRKGPAIYGHRLIYVPELMMTIRRHFDIPNSANPLDGIMTVSFLVLDDLGAENTTAWSLEVLYQLINYRYEYFLPTVFTSYLSGKKLRERIGDKMPSRIEQMCMIRDMGTKDYRIKK